MNRPRSTSQYQSISVNDSTSALNTNNPSLHHDSVQLGTPISATRNPSEDVLATLSLQVQRSLESMQDVIRQIPDVGLLSAHQSLLLSQLVRINSELLVFMKQVYEVSQKRHEALASTSSIQLDNLIDMVVSALYGEFNRRQQRLCVALPSFLPTITGCEEGLWRVFTLLLDNATKYSPQGATISLSVEVFAVELTVRIFNSGVSLSPDELMHVFEPLYRGKQAQHIAGNGLGLSLAKAIVEQHGGRIWATSSPESGTLFAFTLPRMPCI
jgi:signal transduction histidine kinase